MQGAKITSFELPSLLLITLQFAIMDTNSNEKVIENDQNAILEACSSGDLPMLQKLLDDTALQPGSERSALRKLLEAAVASKQTTIVKFLLQEYPTHSFYEEFAIIQSILDNGDADTLRVLCAHDPRLASTSIDYHFRCFITDACARPPEKIVPVLHVLLDNDADVNDGCGPGGGALYAALLGSQPREIIDRIVQNGGEVSFRVLSAAVERERMDILQSLLQKGWVRNSDQLEQLVQCAKETGNHAAITMVQTFALDWAAKRERQERIKRKRATRRWWQVWRYWGYIQSGYFVEMQ